MTCPCGTNLDFSQCCEPFLKNEKHPDSAEKLMRSRYSAFVTGQIEYIRETLAPDRRKDFDVSAAEDWSRNSKWLGLKILSVRGGGPADKKGTVEFTAKYSTDEKIYEHHEVSEFKKVGDQWYFVDGDSHTHEDGKGHHHHHHHEPVVRESPKIGRNDPCPCGSGKKYKKCCGV